MQSQGGGLASLTDRQVFAQWNEVKIDLDARPHPDFYFYEREVWWAALGKNIGHEIDGKNANFERPALIVKKYSRYTCLVLPLTTVIKPENKFQSVFNLHQRPNAALLDQSQTISSKRLSRRFGKIDVDLFQKIVLSYSSLIKIDNPALGGVAELPANRTNLLK